MCHVLPPFPMSQADDYIEGQDERNKRGNWLSRVLRVSLQRIRKKSKTDDKSEGGLTDNELKSINCELEELEAPARYRPDSLEALCKQTRFSQDELKRIYRGFKAECPTGLVREDTFKTIYSQFFPQGANSSQYAHYVFNTLDQDRTGVLSFEDFVVGLSVLCRGSLEEKLRWTFNLYDLNNDGRITKEEMAEMVTAVYSLMGRTTEPTDETTLHAKAEQVFQKLDRNQDGVVTLEEFLECCMEDEGIAASMSVFDTFM